MRAGDGGRTTARLLIEFVLFALFVPPLVSAPDASPIRQGVPRIPNGADNLQYPKSPSSNTVDLCLSLELN